jgi:hypothetical protein
MSVGRHGLTTPRRPAITADPESPANPDAPATQGAPTAPEVPTKLEILLARDLVGAVIAGDRGQFDALFNAYDLPHNSRLRSHIAGLGATLAFSALTVRRLTHRLPGEEERDAILCDLDAGTFSDQIDMAVAYPLLDSACGDNKPMRVKNTKLSTATCIVIGATLLARESHHREDSWSRHYARIFHTWRHGGPKIHADFRMSADE